MDENKSWIQIKVKCASRDIDTVSSVMSMVDNGLMIEDFSDVDQILDGVYGDLIDKSILEADRTQAAISVFIPTIKSPAESELFIKQRLTDLGIDFELTHEGVCGLGGFLEAVLQAYQDRKKAGYRSHLGGIYPRRRGDSCADGSRYGIWNRYSRDYQTLCWIR